MIPDELLERDHLGFEEWSTTPSEDDLTPEESERQKQRSWVRTKLADGPDAVCVTHTDADGLGAGAMVTWHEGPGTVVVPVGYSSPYALEHAIEDLANAGPLISDTDVYVTDLGCDEPPEGLAEVADHAASAQWWDHHQWDGDSREAVVCDAGWEVRVDVDVCATSLLCRDLLDDPPERLARLAEATEDHDLWVHDLGWSERLGAAAEALDPKEYVSAALNREPEELARDEVVSRWLDDQRALEQAAVARADLVEVCGLEVAYTYTRGGRTSVVGNTLVEEEPHMYDAAVVMRTDGGGSVYSHSEDGTFDRCHLVARELGGGGHPTAAGFDVDFDTFRELAMYWATQGESEKMRVAWAIKGVGAE